MAVQNNTSSLLCLPAAHSSCVQLRKERKFSSKMEYSQTYLSLENNVKQLDPLKVAV